MTVRFLAIAACLILADASSLSEVFDRTRCLDGEPLFPFRNRKWVFEVNTWASQRLVTAIAAIIARDRLGYDIVMNEPPSSVGTCRRVLFQWLSAAEDGTTVTRLVQAGETFGYANMEVWTNRDDCAIDSDSSDGNLGNIGYEGMSGWWIPANHLNGTSHVETWEMFYRMYVERPPGQSGGLEGTLRGRLQAADCNGALVCRDPTAERCAEKALQRQGVQRLSSELIWCPSPAQGNGAGSSPAVLCEFPDYDKGLNEEIARSNNLNFALRYMGTEYLTAAWDAASRQNMSLILYAYRPSILFTMFDTAGIELRRWLLPIVKPCGTHHEDGTGTWHCDFPPTTLVKAVSRNVEGDHIIKHFLRRFQITPEEVEPSKRNDKSLIGASIDEMVARAYQGLGEPTGEAVFEVACRWVRENEFTGTTWKSWVLDREWLPRVADSLSEIFPYVQALTMLIAAGVMILCMEGPWLRSTLWPPTKRKLLKEHKFSWRSKIEMEAKAVDKDEGEGWSFAPDRTKALQSYMEHVQPHVTLNLGSALDAMVATRSTDKRLAEYEMEDEDGTEKTKAAGASDQEVAEERSARFWAKAEKWAQEASLIRRPHGDLGCLPTNSFAAEGRSSASRPHSARSDNVAKACKMPSECATWEFQKSLPKVVNGAKGRNLVSFVHHTFPCLRSPGEVRILLRRRPSFNTAAVQEHIGMGTQSLQSGMGTQSLQSVAETRPAACDGARQDDVDLDSMKEVGLEEEVVVQVTVEACSGGAVAGRDFDGTKGLEVVFRPGEQWAVLQVPVCRHYDGWDATSWFQVRLTTVVKGPGMLAYPSCARVLLLSEGDYPPHLSRMKDTDWGIRMWLFYVREGRLRRGVKWWKTMAAMLYMPFHSVVVSTLVQKFLIDHAARRVLDAESESEVDGCYYEVIILVSIMFVSLNLVRWADAVQTRNRGRTGGFRQDHRWNLIRKFLSLEHMEHTQTEGPTWFYCGVVEINNIVMKAYWVIFRLAQCLVGLLLSIFVAIFLLMWDTWVRRTASSGTWQPDFNPSSIIGIFVIIPIGVGTLVLRRRMVEGSGIARLDEEKQWYEAFAWITLDWRSLIGSPAAAKAAFLKHFSELSGAFCKHHVIARNVYHDTGAVIDWVGGVGYCMMLFFGGLMLIEYRRFGLGYMVAGTFYALMRVYRYVDKYMGQFTHTLMSMQQAHFNLLEFASLLNIRDHKWQRGEAAAWRRCWRDEGADGTNDAHPSVRQLPCRRLRLPRELSLVPEICLEDGLCFRRRSGPNYSGEVFKDLELKLGCRLPLGQLIFLSSVDEAAACTFCGLVAGIIHPTGPNGEAFIGQESKLRAPAGVRILMGSLSLAGSRGLIANTILEELRLTGAPEGLCADLATAMGLQISANPAHLPMGSGQLFNLAKALLADPDVLCIHRPLALVPEAMRERVATLLRLWQSGGGLPRLAAWFAAKEEGVAVCEYRSPERTLIISNAYAFNWGKPCATDIHVDLDALRDAIVVM